MESEDITIDSFGRIVIPRAMREELDLAAGAVIKIVCAGGEILLKPVRAEDFSLTKKDGVLVIRGKAQGDLVKAVDTERTRRLKTLSSGLKK